MDMIKDYIVSLQDRYIASEVLEMCDSYNGHCIGSKNLKPIAA